VFNFAVLPFLQTSNPDLRAHFSAHRIRRNYILRVLAPGSYKNTLRKTLKWRKSAASQKQEQKNAYH